MSNVYALQDHEKYDFSMAETFGELIFCAGSRDINTLYSIQRSPANQEVIHRMYKSLKNFKEDDFLIISGNPILIGLAIEFLLTKIGKVTILKWDSYSKQYNPFLLDMETLCKLEHSDNLNN